MASLNSCAFSGRSGTDADLKPVGSTSVAKFRLAVDRYGKKGDPKPAPLWIAVEVWGKQAQIVGDYVKKGTQVIVQGDIDMQEWTNKEGQKQVTPTLRCSQFTLIGGEKAKTTPYAGRNQPNPEEDEVPF